MIFSSTKRNRRGCPHQQIFAFLTIALIFGFATSSTFAATTFTFPDKTPFFSITFPQNWKQLDKDNTGYIEMGTPDDAIYIDVWVLEKSKSPDDTNTISDIMDDMKGWLTDINIKRYPDADFEAGGMKFASVSGTGKLKDGGDLQVVEADICSPNGKDLVAIVYYGDKGADAKYKDDLASIYQSIKKL